MSQEIPVAINSSKNDPVVLELFNEIVSKKTTRKGKKLELKNVSIKEYDRGNFEVVVIDGIVNEAIFQTVGVSKRNPKDMFTPLTGLQVALNRAIEELFLVADSCGNDCTNCTSCAV